VVLRSTDGKRSFEPDELRSILEVLASLSRYSDGIQRNGGDFSDYLDARKNGHLPDYMVKVREGNEESILYFADEEDLRSFAGENRDLRLFGEVHDEEDEEETVPTGGPTRRAVLYELHESHVIGKLLDELTEGEGEKETVTPVFSVPEILDQVLAIGRRGLTIKRFKGLGEMNAKELYSTTMDPETRQLLRVRLDDDNALEADTMLDTLMGDVVEPRKRFIEDNALNVRNLDV
jgi:DNA gyrase subunit B